MTSRRLKKDIEEDLKKALAQVTQKDTDLATLTKERDDARQERDTARGETSSLQTKIAALEKDKTDLTTKVAGLEAGADATLQQELDEARA